MRANTAALDMRLLSSAIKINRAQSKSERALVSRGRAAATIGPHDGGPLGHHVRPKISRTVKLDFGKPNSGLEKGSEMISSGLKLAVIIARPLMGCEWWQVEYGSARARALWRWPRPRKLSTA